MEARHRKMELLFKEILNKYKNETTERFSNIFNKHRQLEDFQLEKIVDRDPLLVEFENLLYTIDDSEERNTFLEKLRDRFVGGDYGTKPRIFCAKLWRM